MNTTTTDGDPQFYLQKEGEPPVSVINKFRADKGDMDGHVSLVDAAGRTLLPDWVKDEKVAKDLLNEHQCQRITHAWVKDETILRSLIRDGYLEEEHQEYGFAWLELSNAAGSKLQHRLNAACLEDLVGNSISGAEAMEMYDEVMRIIKLERSRIIVHACNAREDEDAASRTAVGRNVYRECFEMLVRALDGARIRHKQRKEKELAEDPLLR